METNTSKPDQSHIEHRTGGGSSFVGKDSVNLYRAVVLASSLKLWARTGMIPTRGVTITKMLAIATEYTGKKYGRGKDEAMRAHDEVKTWADTMKAAIPTTVDGEAV